MSQDALRQKLRIRRGDDWGDEVTLEFVDGDGAPMDITGAEIWMTFRESIVRSATATDETDSPVVQLTSPAVVDGPGGIVVLDGPAGTARPLLTPAQTKKFVRKYHTYDVQIRPASGPLAGKIRTTQEGHVETLDERTLSV